MIVDLETIGLLGPELVLLCAATWIYIVGAFTRRTEWWTGFAVGAYILAALVMLVAEGSFWSPPAGSTQPLLVSGPLVVDVLGQLIRFLALALGLSLTLIAAHTPRRELSSEFLGTLMLVMVGLMLTARANELVFLFLALELISIPTYVLLFLGKSGREASEATVKYFFLSILSSALLLYGFACLYGMAGTTLIAGVEQFQGIREALVQLQGPLAPLAMVALVLIVAGAGFKIAAVPFHFYAPDVYQGTSNANAALLAVVPKIAGVVVLVRLVASAMPNTDQFAWVLVAVLSMVTMTMGNVCALWQQNLRRLLAYSSIAHAGYLLIGLAVAAAATGDLAATGLAAMLFYLLVYSGATLGTFAALIYLGSREREVSDVSELAGLARSHPLAAGALAAFMFSLAGIPPLAGFWGKLMLFSGALGVVTSGQSGEVALWVALAVVAALNAAIGAAYYLRIVAIMYFRSPTVPLPAAGGTPACLVTAACALLVVLVGVLPGLAMRGAHLAGRQARGSVAQQPADPMKP